MKKIIVLVIFLLIISTAVYALDPEFSDQYLWIDLNISSAVTINGPYQNVDCFNCSNGEKVKFI